MYTTLSIEIQQGLVTIWMDRPEVFNAFYEILIQKLKEACAALEVDTSVRIVVLAGRGKHFSAGADLNWMKRAAIANYDENLRDARNFADMLNQLACLSKPTIARIQGAALGGGTGLAAACDIVIASEDTRFATSEVLFGILPAVISPYVLRAIGPRHAKRYFQTGECFGAQRAYELGLMSKVVALDQLDNALVKVVSQLLKGGPLAQAACKELIQVIAEMPFDMDMREETAKRIATQRSTQEAKKGISAFLEKRSAHWISIQ